MSSVYPVSPSSLHGHRDRSTDHHAPHYNTPVPNQNHNLGLNPVGAPIESTLLSPHSSYIQSNSASPSCFSNTPAESVSTQSLYQSDYSEDPFFGLNFDEPQGGTPTFLDEQLTDTQSGTLPTTADPFGYVGFGTTNDGLSVTAGGVGSGCYPVVEQSNPESPRALPTTTSHPGPLSCDTDSAAMQPAIDANQGNWSNSDGSLAPSHAPMPCQSPRVTVSFWERDGEHHACPVERGLKPGPAAEFGADDVNPWAAQQGSSMDDAGSVRTMHGSLSSVSRDAQGTWQPDQATGLRGLAPGERSSQETESINQLAAGRQLVERNAEVAAWVSEASRKTVDLPFGVVGFSPSSSASIAPADEVNTKTDDIAWDDSTENKFVPEQPYYRTDLHSRPITQEDLDVMHQTAPWFNAPRIHEISQNGHANQPQTSQDAMEKFERMCRDNESMVSRAATWGTRRRSLPSVADVDGVTSGSFFKRLSISRGDSSSSPRRASFLHRIPSIVRMPSTGQRPKRRPSNADESSSDEPPQTDRRQSKDSLVPPSRTSSWGMKTKPTPNINTALYSMAKSAASIGTSQVLSGSISTPSVTSPKSSFGLPQVKNPLRSQRSKTELPKSQKSMETLVVMLRKGGGPPVARPPLGFDQDDDEDEDDDGQEDEGPAVEFGAVEDIVPTYQGFQDHILRLNPGLKDSNGYLVERIAHQMNVRFKNLQQMQIKHKQSMAQSSCSSGMLCVAQGGAAKAMDNRGDIRCVDPLSGQPDVASPGGSIPLEGEINASSFPKGIPMPPASFLPAELECQLCFASKRFQKPSDWTKHVHEDVQPFTCTWEHCRDPKMFKRKADWVRHENEGHRHLEWWTCDVDECQHICYRRDNFLQHLVREHKFSEPKVKTKAAIKKAGGADPTWQKVDGCHVVTEVQPQAEPCRFCGKRFPTWKKLTVHLAKHMENISLPVLRLVDGSKLDQDTVISPVLDPPPRSFGLLPVPKQEPTVSSPRRPHAASNPNPIGYSTVFPCPAVTRQTLNASHLVSAPTTIVGFGMQQHQHASDSGFLVPQPGAGVFNAPPQYHALPLTRGSPFEQTADAYMAPAHGQMEPFPSFNQLGFQDSNGNRMGYDSLGDPTMQNAEQYSSGGSVSPYSNSPHHAPGGFY